MRLMGFPAGVTGTGKKREGEETGRPFSSDITYAPPARNKEPNYTFQVKLLSYGAGSVGASPKVLCQSNGGA